MNQIAWLNKRPYCWAASTDGGKTWVRLNSDDDEDSSGAAMKHCECCGKQLRSRKPDARICSACGNKYQCMICGARGIHIVASMCDPCRLVVLRLSEVHDDDNSRLMNRSRTPERTARMERYADLATAGLPLFERTRR